MIKVAIVDDETHMLEMIQKYIEDRAGEENILDVSAFENAEKFLKRLEWGESFHILFTDISFPGMSGIKLGRMVLERCPNIYLVFLTSHSEFAVESYEMNAYQYILKQNMKERIPAVLDGILGQIMDDNRHYRIVNAKTGLQKIYYSDIIYAYKEKENKYVQYVTVCGEYEERITIKELERELNSPEFVMADRGYIINAKHINGVSANEICMDNGKSVLVSRRRCAKVKEQISQWWRDHR